MGQHIRLLLLSQPHDLEWIQFEGFGNKVALVFLAAGDVDVNGTVGVLLVVFQGPINVLRLGWLDDKERQLANVV